MKTSVEYDETIFYSYYVQIALNDMFIQIFVYIYIVFKVAFLRGEFQYTPTNPLYMISWLYSKWTSLTYVFAKPMKHNQWDKTIQ